VKTAKAIFFSAIIFFTAAPSACNNNGDEQKKPSRLVVYCENGILNPVLEITDHFKKNTGINVKIRNDCARNLVSSLHYHDDADIFIPDATETINNLLMVDSLFFEDKLFLGNQSLIFFIPEGNPEQFDGHLKKLFQLENGMIMANPESSTLGLLTGILLEKNLMYKEAMGSVLFLTTDSRNLMQNIEKKKASVGIGWRSDYTGARTPPKIDTVNIKGVLPSMIHHPASAAVLSSAPNKDAATRYLEFLTSDLAARIFKKYEIIKDSIPGI